MKSCVRWLFAFGAIAASFAVGAANATTDPHAKPSSFAPRTSNGPHVYGAPIQPPIVGPARAPRNPAPAATRARATPRHVAKPVHAPSSKSSARTSKGTKHQPS